MRASLLLFLFSVLSAGALSAQCQIEVFYSPTSLCCGTIEFTYFDGCITSYVDRLSIDTHANPSFEADIHSLTTTTPGVTVMITGPHTADLLFNYNLVDQSLAGVNQTLAKICFSNVAHPLGYVLFRTKLYDQTPTIVSDEVWEGESQCPVPGEFKKIYGTDYSDYPERLITVGNGIYVAGKREVNGQSFAVISKFSVANGTLLGEWTEPFQSEFRDLAYDPSTDRIIAVGSTLPREAPLTDNASLISVFDTDLNFLFQRSYHQSGRETFNRIVVHKSPDDPLASIYILGQKNPNGTGPSDYDVTVLWNMNNNAGLSIKKIMEYNESNGQELETHRGLVDLDNGRLLIVGNGSINNEGALFEVDGTTLNSSITSYYNSGFDFYSGIEHSPGGDLILVGTDFYNDRALILVLEPPFWNVQSGHPFDDLKNFQDIKRDAHGDYYVCSNFKASPEKTAVMKFEYDPSTLVVAPYWLRFLYDQETTFSPPRIDVNTQYDRIFFTDGRKDNPNGIGEHDLLISSTDLEFTCECMTDTTISQGGLSPSIGIFQLVDTQQPLPLVLSPPSPIPSEGICSPFCDLDDDCVIDCEIDCFDVTLSTPTPTWGSPPYVFNWDIGCDGSNEYGGQSVTHSFPASPSPGVYQVCLLVIDSNGDFCEEQKSVTVDDQVPPIISCPVDVILPAETDCKAPYPFTIATVDNCDPAPVIVCTMSGATTGTVSSTTRYELGVTMVTCTSTDASGNSVSCSFTVTVIDTTAPEIDCPQNISVNGEYCLGGAEVFFSLPTATDNCDEAMIVCDFLSGELFPCGVTVVTCTATDLSGNSESCTFTITVNCPCLEIQQSSLICNPQDDNAYDFTIVAQDLGDLGDPGHSCSATATTSQSGVTLSNLMINWANPIVTVTGTATHSGNCPTDLIIDLTLNCSCGNGFSYQCSDQVVIPTVCCHTISIDPMDVCKTGPDISIPVLGCQDLCGTVQQTKWYVADAPCPPVGSFGPPFQSGNGCAPLLLDPRNFTGDVCVYAEVVSSSPGPCPAVMQTAPTTITICDPITVSASADQEYCYQGTPIVPNPLTATISPLPDCPYTVQWYGLFGFPIIGATSLVYQPPGLSLPAGSQDCRRDYTYTVTVTDPCGSQTATAVIRLNNDNAPNGLLERVPSSPDTLCYGDDAVIEYTPACADDPPIWTWYMAQESNPSNFVNLLIGSQNPQFNTNRLYQDHWFRVEKQNGNCPIDVIDLHVPVYEPLSSAIAVQSSPWCAPTSVQLTATWNLAYYPPDNCDFTIDWYHNSGVIGSQSAQQAPVSFTFAPSDASLIPGTYYAVITDNCCGTVSKTPVEVIGQPSAAAISGPCFRCNGETVDLTGVHINAPAGAICSYQWYENGMPIPGATGATLQVLPSMNGPFSFEVTCVNSIGSCTVSDDYSLLQCGLISSTIDLDDFGGAIFPNPTDGKVTIQFDQPIDYESITLMDLVGREVFRLGGDRNRNQFRLDLDDLPRGMYLLLIQVDESTLITERIIKD